MDSPTPEEIRLNIEQIKEDMAVIMLAQNKSSLVLYGSKDAHFPGLLEDVDALKEAIKNINGMPKQVAELTEKVNRLIETDKRRVNFVRGAVVGYGLQTIGLGAILIKVFS